MLPNAAPPMSAPPPIAKGEGEQSPEQVKEMLKQVISELKQVCAEYDIDWNEVAGAGVTKAKSAMKPPAMPPM